jgi:hypothetical protein
LEIINFPRLNLKTEPVPAECSHVAVENVHGVAEKQLPNLMANHDNKGASSAEHSARHQDGGVTHAQTPPAQPGNQEQLAEVPDDNEVGVQIAVHGICHLVLQTKEHVPRTTTKIVLGFTQ